MRRTLLDDLSGQNVPMTHHGGVASILHRLMDHRTGFFGHLLTLPNLLTLSRIPLAGLVWFRPSDPPFVLGLMVVAGITDVLDGWLERRQKRPGPSLGTWLDPLCDKIFLFSVLAAVTAAQSLPWWILPLVAFREILQTLIVGLKPWIPVLRRRLQPRFQANVLGKATTILQFLTIGAILLHRPGRIPLALSTAGLGLVATVVYLRRAWSPLPPDPTS